MQQTETGCLYIVATPIGNSADLSPRGRKILEEADLIAAEDTRRSMVLLNKLEIRNRLVSNHKFNEHGKANWFVQQMQEGKNVAVITDAGTPCISDPGNELIKFWASFRERMPNESVSWNSCARTSPQRPLPSMNRPNAL